MAPAVHAFSQNYAKRPQTQRTPGIVSRSAGGLGKAALGALAIGGIAALAGSQRGEIPPDDGGVGGGGPGGGGPGGVDLGGPVETRSTPSDRGFFATARAKRAADVESSAQRRNYRQRSGSRVEQPSQGTSDEFIQDIWGEEPSQQPPSQPSITERADDKASEIRNLVKAPSSEVVEPVERANVEVVGNPLANIRSSWGNRTAAGPRIQVNESEYKPVDWSVEKTERSVLNPWGRRLVKNPIVVGKNPDGSDKYMQPKAALTGGDQSLIPRQWPPVKRVHWNDMVASMMTGTTETGLGPLIDGGDIGIPFLAGPHIHIPGAMQIANYVGPVAVAGARKAAGDALEAYDLASSGIGYVAKNLRPILKQGREDWSKGYRDIRTGVQDLGLVRDTANQLMLAAAMKRDQDLGLIEGGAQRVMTWAQKQRGLEGRPLPGTGQLEAGVEHDLGDNAQIDDPQQVHEQHQIPPSKGGWKQKHYGQKAAERQMRWDAIRANRDQQVADFIDQYGTRQEWVQAEMDQAIAEQDLLDKQVSASRNFEPDESTKYAEWGVQQGGRPFVRYQKGEPVRYEYETRPDVSRRIENFLTKGGFDYFSDVRPREIIDSTMDDPDIRKLNRDQW
jgi:hypothetical protein